MTTKPIYAVIVPLGDAPTGPPWNLPSQGLPTQPPVPGQPLPTPPPGQIDNTLPEVPPGTTLPPQIDNSLPIYGGKPENPIALPPGMIWPPLPGTQPKATVMIAVNIQGIGTRWVVIDPSLRPDQGLPPSGAQPKRGR